MQKAILLFAACCLAGACLAPRDLQGRDPRIDFCPIGDNRVEAAFAIDRARDYREHLRLMGRSPELETDEPAFVVIFEGPGDFVVQQAPPGPGGVAKPPAAPGSPSEWLVCVIVGTSPNVYTGVDIAGWSAEPSR